MRLLLVEVPGFFLMNECLCCREVSVDFVYEEKNFQIYSIFRTRNTKVGLANLEQLEYLLTCHVYLLQYF